MKRRCMTACAVIASVILLTSFGATVQAADESPLRAGIWRAWLDSPGGDLPFGLELRVSGNAWSATIINGDERIDVPVVELAGDELTLSIDYYDSTLRGKVSQDGTRLDGEWKKKGRGAEWSTLPFHAEAGVRERFPGMEKPTMRPAPGKEYPCLNLEGRWSVKFESSEEPAIAEFKEVGGGITGTFLTTTGDYRFLAGAYDRSRVLRLSAFDGAHAFLFQAKCQKGGILQGDFWSRDAWHETWTAKRDPHATLPDAFKITSGAGRVDMSQLRFPDVDGNERSLGDAEFAGKAYVLDIFGTWCPNCYDASNYLKELHAKYKDRGLSIVGLAFELTGDFNRDARQVKRYVERHKIDYPVLVAGEAIREKVAERVPVIDQLRAYPTLVFIDAAGDVRAVYTGFNGPATGDAHLKMRADIEALVESILGE